jgi:carboxyl-terminal processing protease
MKVNGFAKSAGLVLAGAVMAGVAMHALGAAGAATGSAETYKLLGLFGDVFDRVRADYVEEPDQKKMIESAINGMLTSLDPHSSYMDAEKFDDMNVQTKGEFGGLGIEVTMENGVVKVMAPYDGTPASKAGILANDLIVKIDNLEVQGLTLNEAVDKMRGAVGTPVNLTIAREGREPFEVKIVRDIIKVESVKFELMGDDVGYIRMSSFTEQSDTGVEKAVAELDKKSGGKIKGYILDLRNNPGGLLLQAVSVSDIFLERGEVVSTRGRSPEDVERHSAGKGDLTMAARPRPRKSSQAPFRTTSAPRLSAPAPSARVRCKPSFRSAMTAPSASPPSATTRLPAAPSRPRALMLTS